MSLNKKVKKNLVFDIVVVGAGPTGLHLLVDLLKPILEWRLLINYQGKLLPIQK
jgi:ribulose 1,5-bisphosphate synthetase/thiazole synthase